MRRLKFLSGTIAFKAFLCYFITYISVFIRVHSIKFVQVVSFKKMAVLWVDSPCIVVGRWWLLDGGSKYLWNVGKLLSDYTTQNTAIFILAAVRTPIFKSVVLHGDTCTVAQLFPIRDTTYYINLHTFRFITRRRRQLPPPLLLLALLRLPLDRWDGLL
jgi:hypothetical protein